MSFTAGSVMAQSAGLLNDASRNQWTDAVLLPMLVLACQELDLEYANNSMPALREISAANTIAIGVKTLAPVANFMAPIKLQERLVGETTEESWTDMVQKGWEPSIDPSDDLVYWVYRENEFKFPGATTTREVRYFYYKSNVLPDSQDDSLVIINTDLFLIYKTAGLAAKHLGMMPTKGNDLISEGKVFLNKAVGREVKSLQGMPRRRRGYGVNRRRLGNSFAR